MNKSHDFFVTCPKNLEGLLEEELISLGVSKTKQTVAGVNFTGGLVDAYRVCLWSRLANRVLLKVATINAENVDALYQGVKKVDWLKHVRPEGSIAVDFSGTTSAINNSHFGALKVKDGIVDFIRNKTGKRPDVNKDNPDLRINVYLYHELATVSIDLSGESLHRRGYRFSPGEAPLKENLAAAILCRCKWEKLSEENKPLLDPMCGSGTFLIEAAMIAEDYAPGLLRKHFGFNRWLGHDEKVWQDLLTAAKKRHAQGAAKCQTKIYGCDLNSEAIAIAKEHISNAGLENRIQLKLAEAKNSVSMFDFVTPGLVITNPPYGKRLRQDEGIGELYRDLGKLLRDNFLDWEAAIFTGNPELGKNLGLRPFKQYNFFNGTIPCKLLLFSVVLDSFWREYR